MKEFKCPKCGHNQIEEVLPGVTQSSVITDVAAADECDVALEYGAISCDGGDFDQVRYQCVKCGESVHGQQLMDLVEPGGTCEDCGEGFLAADLRPWKYEPEIKLCEGCTDARMAKDDPA